MRFSDGEIHKLFTLACGRSRSLEEMERKTAFPELLLCCEFVYGSVCVCVFFLMCNYLNVHLQLHRGRRHDPKVNKPVVNPNPEPLPALWHKEEECWAGRGTVRACVREREREKERERE